MTTDIAAIAATNGCRTAGAERFDASHRLVVIRSELPDISNSLAEAIESVTLPLHNYDAWRTDLVRAEDYL